MDTSKRTKELPMTVPELKSGGYTHLGFGALRRVNGLGLVKLRFHVTLGDAVPQLKTSLRVNYN